MTPYFSDDLRYNFIVNNTNAIGYTFIHIGHGISGNIGIRPVINLKKDIKAIGSGTYNDPYTVY